MKNIENKKIETDVAILELDERGFMIITIKDTLKTFDEEEAKRQIAAAYTLTDGERYKILVDASQSFVTPTLEAKKLIAEVEHKIREAVVVKSLGTRILGNLYLKIINQRYPSKLFTSKEGAIDWLMKDK